MRVRGTRLFLPETGVASNAAIGRRWSVDGNMRQEPRFRRAGGCPRIDAQRVSNFRGDAP